MFVAVQGSADGEIRKFVFSYERVLFDAAKSLKNERKRTGTVSAYRAVENQWIIFGIRARFKFVAECVSVCFASVNARVVTVIISSAYLYDIYVVSERRFCDDVAAKVEVGFNAEFFNGVFALFGYVFPSFVTAPPRSLTFETPSIVTLLTFPLVLKLYAFENFCSPLLSVTLTFQK